ncbi:hypothetical protein Taro_022344 [Colocasia esculenta]|uniref:Uncharacterized protein n=1 Tax=Colocasia esculenta TaxID=4460 RepID=A0A843VE83_COLES|nr:hypothetical protein [Colocasia esculenta]
MVATEVAVTAVCPVTISWCRFPITMRLSLLPETPILESLLRECSGLRACSSWQPTGWTLELRGKRGLDSGTESFVELSCLGWDAEVVEEVLFLTRPRQSFVSLPCSTLVLEPCREVRHEAAAWPGCGVACVVSFCGGSVSPFCGGGGRSQAASGGGLVVVVVTMLPHGIFRGGIGVCGFPALWHVHGLGWFCLCAEDCFHFVPDSVARGSPSWELDVGWVTEAAVALCVVSNSESECCELLYRVS